MEIERKPLGMLNAIVLWPATFGGYRAASADQLITEELDVRARILLPSMHYATLRKLVVDFYEGESFIGCTDDGFRFSKDKSNGVWRESDRSQVLLVASPADLLLEIKQDVRKICGVGRHAIHTTDTPDEVERVWSASQRLHATGFDSKEVYFR